MFFIDWEQPRTIHDEPKYDSPHTSLRKLYSNRFPKGEGKSSRITSDIIASKRRRSSHRTNRNTSPNELSRSSSTEKYTPDFSSVCSIARSPMQEATERTHNFPISIWRTYFIADEWCKLQTRRRINVALQSICTLCVLQVSCDVKEKFNFVENNLNNHFHFRHSIWNRGCWRYRNRPSRMNLPKRGTILRCNTRFARSCTYPYISYSGWSALRFMRDTLETDCRSS